MNLLCLSYDEVAFTTLLRVFACARERDVLSPDSSRKKSAPAVLPHVKATEWDQSMNRINSLPKKTYLIARIKHLILNKKYNFMSKRVFPNFTRFSFMFGTDKYILNNILSIKAIKSI